MKIIWQDIAFLVGMILYISVGISTKFVVTTVGAYTQLAQELEGNPIARAVVDTRYYFTMMQWLAISFFSGVYVMMRRKQLGGVLDKNNQLLTFYVIALLVLFGQNLANDLPVAIKLFMGG